MPLLEMLARKADRKTNRELTLLYHRLAKAADKLGENEKALKYYKQSYDLDSTYLPTLVDRAGAALPARALGRRVPHLPDHPGPPPRHAEGRRDRRHLLPPGAHQAEARRAHQGGEHVREGAGDSARPPGDAAGAHRPLHRGGRLRGGHQAEARRCWRRRRRPPTRSSRSPRRSPGSTRTSSTTRRRRSPRTSRRSTSSRTIASCCTTCSISSARPSSGRRRWRS